MVQIIYIIYIDIYLYLCRASGPFGVSSVSNSQTKKRTLKISPPLGQTFF